MHTYRIELEITTDLEDGPVDTLIDSILSQHPELVLRDVERDDT